MVAALVGRRWRGDADARFGLVWLAVMVVVLSCSRFKRADYLLPAYAGAAIFLGCAARALVSHPHTGTRRRAACGFALALALLPAWWVGFDRFVTADEEAAHAQAPFARAVRTPPRPPTPVLLFRVESHLLAYHLGRPVHTLVEWSDLDARLRSAGPHFVVTRAESLDELRRHVAGPVEVVARSENANRAAGPPTAGPPPDRHPRMADQPAEGLTVALPVFDQEKTLAKAVSGWQPVLDGLQRPYEFLVVDDGSRDGTRGRPTSSPPRTCA